MTRIGRFKCTSNTKFTIQGHERHEQDDLNARITRKYRLTKYINSALENEELHTPCFILDKNDLVNNIRSFNKALAKHFSKHIIGYSVKTNSLPYVLKLAKDNGCYAEVVSYQEYALALKIGFQPQHIIYNGPLRSKESFLKAVTDGAIVNIETWREIEWLKELPKDKSYKVGIRININISKVSPADEAESDDNSRFGFSFETSELKHAIERVDSLGNVKIVGIHTHREPKTRSIKFYQNVIEYVQQAIEALSLQLEYWDLGGGFFGPMPGKPTFEDYSEGFYSAMAPWARQLNIIVEPGNAIVASSFDYVTEVLDVKQHDNKIFVTTNGTRNDIDPFFHKHSYFTEIKYKANHNQVAELPQIVGGLSCLEYDRLFTIEAGSKSLVVGDTIIYKRVGASTMALTPLFIHYFPTVYMKEDNKLSVIRKEWNEDDFLKENLY